MKVLLVGKTEVDLFPFQGDSRHRMPGKAEGSKFEKRVMSDTGIYGPFARGESGQELIEFAGRLCYESFDLPRESTSGNGDYVQNVISQGHESVLEHVSVTFYVEGVSRNLSHELIRHRHLSFSELSQRFVDMSEAKTVVPPAMGGGLTKLSDAHKHTYKHFVDLLKGEGKTRKQAREAARYGLPSGLETKFIVSGNLRAWRDVLKKRLSVHADAEMQEFAQRVWDELSYQYPDVFADIDWDSWECGAASAETPELAAQIVAERNAAQRPAEDACVSCPQRATRAELDARQRHARHAAGQCPMCARADTTGRLCDDCTRTVRALPPAERRPWDRFRQRPTGAPIQGHGYTPAGLLGIDATTTGRTRTNSE